MIRIRAGIIYNIVNLQITKQHANEIFYWSNNPEFVTIMGMINDILSMDVCYPPPVDFEYLRYFVGYESIAKQYLKDVDLGTIAYYFLEYQKFEKIENPISQWRVNTKGQTEEKNAIYRFNKVYGFTISSIKRGDYMIEGTNIVISGTPDGIITSSPGGIFDGYLVEIKYQTRTNDKTKIRNKYQISSYCKIFNKPVMLIVFLNNKYNVYHFTVETLNKIWNKDILPGLKANIKNIQDKLLIRCPQDITTYYDYINSFGI